MLTGSNLYLYRISLPIEIKIRIYDAFPVICSVKWLYGNGNP